MCSVGLMEGREDRRSEGKRWRRDARERGRG